MAASKWTLRIVLAVFALLISTSAHAANNCPWLTEATVGGLLGGMRWDRTLPGRW